MSVRKSRSGVGRRAEVLRLLRGVLACSVWLLCSGSQPQWRKTRRWAPKRTVQVREGPRQARADIQFSAVEHPRQSSVWRDEADIINDQLRRGEIPMEVWQWQEPQSTISLTTQVWRSVKRTVASITRRSGRKNGS